MDSYRSRLGWILAITAGACALLAPSASAQTWGTPEKVSLHAQSSSPADLALSGSPSGRAVAIWRDGAGNLVSGAILPAGSFDFGAPGIISDGGPVTNPKVSVGTGGVAVVAWEINTGDHFIKASRLDAAGTAFGAPLTALDSAVSGQHMSEPAVAVTPSGEATIVSDGPGTFSYYEHQYATSQGSGGGAWTTPLQNFSGNNVNQFPIVAAGAHESVIWIGKHDDITARALSVAGMTASTNVWAQGAGIAGGDGNGTGCLCGFGHQLARLANGDAVVMIFRNSGGPGQDLFTMTFDLARAQNSAPGTLEPAHTPLSTNATNRAGGDRRMVSNSAGTTAAVWGGTANNIWISMRADGGSFSVPEQIVPSGADPGLDAAIAGNGDVHIVYTSGDKVYGIIRKANGTVTSPDQISGAETSVGSPKVTAFTNGSAVAIWRGNDPDEGGVAKVFAAGYDSTAIPNTGGNGGSAAGATPPKKCKKGQKLKKGKCVKKKKPKKKGRR